MTDVPGYQQRAREEFEQLIERKDKLEEFFETDTFEELSLGDKKLLIGQLIAMSNYHAFLELRLEVWDARAQAQCPTEPVV